jgi:hypothetical protein
MPTDQWRHTSFQFEPLLDGVTSAATVGPKDDPPPLKFQLVAAPSSMTATSFSSLSVCANALLEQKNKTAIIMNFVACAIPVNPLFVNVIEIGVRCAEYRTGILTQGNFAFRDLAAASLDTSRQRRIFFL